MPYGATGARDGGSEGLKNKRWISESLHLNICYSPWMDSRVYRLIHFVLSSVECTQAETSPIPRARYTRGHKPEGRWITGEARRCYFNPSFFFGESQSRKETTNAWKGANARPLGSCHTGNEPGPPLSSIPRPCGRTGRFVLFQRALPVSAGNSCRRGAWSGSS
jgi:hypothetical protein